MIPCDYREYVESLVYSDLRLRFDGNRFGVPQRYFGTAADDQSRRHLRDDSRGRNLLRCCGAPNAPS